MRSRFSLFRLLTLRKTFTPKLLFKKYYLLKIRNKLLIKFVYYYNLKIVIEGNFYSLRTHSLHSNIQLSRTYNNCGIHNLIRRMYRIICLIRVSRIHRNVIVKTKLLCLLIHFFFTGISANSTAKQRSQALKMLHWRNAI